LSVAKLTEIAASLLFEILDSEAPRVSAEVLLDSFPLAGAALLDAGMLTTDGYETVITASADSRICQ
jgi:hypothetical protein